jgi:hypothetical protein
VGDSATRDIGHFMAKEIWILESAWAIVMLSVGETRQVVNCVRAELPFDFSQAYGAFISQELL